MIYEDGTCNDGIDLAKIYLSKDKWKPPKDTFLPKSWYEKESGAFLYALAMPLELTYTIIKKE